MPEIKKETKINKKNIEKKVAKPVKKVVKKDVVGSKKSGIKVATPKTMRNKSGIHKINPRINTGKQEGVIVKVSIVGVDGASKGNMSLPVEIFGTTPNSSLISQAVRVYLANQRQGNASTKTRHEVVGSTRKIYRQKGTGRARHGALKAPLFVGGGVAHGPKPHDFSLEFPKKMRKAALISALSLKAQMGSVKVIEGEFTGKTKEFVGLIKSMELNTTGKIRRSLFVMDDNANAARAAHNISGVEIENASTLSTYGVFISHNVVFLKNSISKLAERLSKN